MNPAPTQSPIATLGAFPGGSIPGGIAAGFGMLCALLAALLGLAVTRPRAMADAGTMGLVIRTVADAEVAPVEEWVEWIAVPAPWRAGQGVGRSCARVRGAGAPRPRQIRARRGRGPPWRPPSPCTEQTGMA